MKRTLLLALAWAAAIIGVAAAGRSGVIPDSSAETLVIVLPALAVASLGVAYRKGSCGARA